MAAYGTKGVRLGFQGLNSTAFDTDAIMQNAQWSQDAEVQEFRDPDSGAYIFVNVVANAEKATFTYLVGSDQLTTSASIVKPSVGSKFTATETGVSSSLSTSTWIATNVSFTEVPMLEGATEVTVEATNYGF
jgi:hypothetical protein